MLVETVKNKTNYGSIPSGGKSYLKNVVIIPPDSRSKLIKNIDPSGPAIISFTTQDVKPSQDETEPPTPSRFSRISQIVRNIKIPAVLQEYIVCILGIVAVLVFIVLPLLMGAMGYVYWDKCPENDIIPELLMAGSIILILMPIFITEFKLNPNMSRFFTTLIFIDYVALVAGYIAASFAVYGFYLYSDGNVDHTRNCDENLLVFTFWIMVFFPLILFAILGILVTGIMKFFSRSTTHLQYSRDSAQDEKRCL